MDTCGFTTAVSSRVITLTWCRPVSSAYVATQPRFITSRSPSTST
jgi:hypothetical protein